MTSRTTRTVSLAITPTTRDIPLAVRILVPTALGLALLGLWEILVRVLEVPKFVLPPPSLIGKALGDDFPSLLASLWVTLRITIEAFVIALAGGLLLAILSARSRLFELCLFPYAVILQVTPVVAIAPLILIWVGIDHLERALLILATIVAFFPILSNTTLGLKSVNPELNALFKLYGASSWQRLALLDLPNALPYLLAGMKISGGLALIGAVVAEFVAGSGSGTGLAWRVVESANNLDIPRMFAALALLSALGLSIFFLLVGLQHLLLRRWHESAMSRES
ncbi:MAG: ssuC [Rhodospirillales bacterium]|nr:ssuC [Rhodospirillales bacterium]